jgi:hypothetical protein
VRLKLRIEPVPISTWGKSLAGRLPKKEWDDLRFSVYRNAGYECEICGDGSKTLHAHEVWKFDDRKAIQVLVKVECLCETCHNVKHFGRSKEVYPESYIKTLVKHWCKVNGRKPRDLLIHEREVFEINKKRANRYYIVKVGRRILV